MNTIEWISLLDDFSGLAVTDEDYQEELDELLIALESDEFAINAFIEYDDITLSPLQWAIVYQCPPLVNALAIAGADLSVVLTETVTFNDFELAEGMDVVDLAQVCLPELFDLIDVESGEASSSDTIAHFREEEGKYRYRLPHSGEPEEIPFLPTQGAKGFLGEQGQVHNLWHLVDEQFFSVYHDDDRVAVLHGDAGAGKSVFMDYLEWQLGCDPRYSDMVVMSAPIPGLINPVTGLLASIAQHKKVPLFTLLRQLKESSTVFLLDGYDEASLTANLYDENQLCIFPNLRLLIGCRSQYLLNVPNYSARFLGTPGSRLLEFRIYPFSENQIEEYLSQVDSELSAQQLIEEVHAIPGLDRLVTTPFMLYVIAKLLPTVLSSTQRPEYLNFNYLAKLFLTDWFDREMKKYVDLTGDGYDVITRETLPEHIDYCHRYVLGLAKTMVEEKQSSLKYSMQQVIDRIGMNPGPDAIYLRACPLRIGKGILQSYRFIHSKLFDYLTARLGMADVQILDQWTVQQYLEYATLVQDGDILPRSKLNDCTVGYLTQQDQEGEAYRRIFIGAIHASREDPRCRIVAANAMTYLAAAGVPLDNQDFSGINVSAVSVEGLQLQSADFTGAILRGTNFEGANLQGVNFSLCDLTYVNLTNASLEGATFGELGEIYGNGSPINAIAASPSGRLLAFGHGIEGDQKNGGPARDCHIRIWDNHEDDLIQLFSGHKDKVLQLDFIDDCHLISRSADNIIRIWCWDDVSANPNLQGYKSFVIHKGDDELSTFALQKGRDNEVLFGFVQYDNDSDSQMLLVKQIRLDLISALMNDLNTQLAIHTVMAVIIKSNMRLQDIKFSPFLDTVGLIYSYYFFTYSLSDPGCSKRFRMEKNNALLAVAVGDSYDWLISRREDNKSAIYGYSNLFIQATKNNQKTLAHSYRYQLPLGEVASQLIHDKSNNVLYACGLFSVFGWMHDCENKKISEEPLIYTDAPINHAVLIDGGSSEAVFTLARKDGVVSRFESSALKRAQYNNMSHKNKVNLEVSAVAYSSASRRIAFASGLGVVSICNIDTGRILYQWATNKAVFDIHFFRDGKYLLIEANGSIELWSAERSISQLGSWITCGSQCLITDSYLLWFCYASQRFEEFQAGYGSPDMQAIRRVAVDDLIDASMEDTGAADLQERDYRLESIEMNYHFDELRLSVSSVEKSHMISPDLLLIVADNKDWSIVNIETMMIAKETIGMIKAVLAECKKLSALARYDGGKVLPVRLSADFGNVHRFVFRDNWGISGVLLFTGLTSLLIIDIHGSLISKHKLSNHKEAFIDNAWFISSKLVLVTTSNGGSLVVNTENADIIPVSLATTSLAFDIFPFDDGWGFVLVNKSGFGVQAWQFSYELQRLVCLWRFHPSLCISKIIMDSSNFVWSNKYRRLLHAGTDDKAIESGGDHRIGLQFTRQLNIVTAALHGDVKLLERWFKITSTLDVCDKNSLHVFNLACTFGHEPIIKLMVAYGLDVVMMTKQYAGVGYHSAIMFGHLDVVRFLLEMGVSANDKFAGTFSPLMIAARYNQKKMAAILLDFGAMINDTILGGRTALHLACIHNATEVAELLVQSGADADAADRFMTPIKYAAMQGNHQIVNMLACSTEGNNAAMLSHARWGDWFLAYYHHGCFFISLLAFTSHVWQSIVAVQETDDFLRDVVNNIISTPTNSLFISAIMLLKSIGFSDVAGSELMMGFWLIGMSQINGFKFFDIQFAGRDFSYLVNIVFFILVFGTHAQKLINEYRFGRTKTESKSSINPGSTALHCGAFNGDVDTVRLLLHFGLDPLTKDIYGKSSIDIAFEKGNHAAAELLQCHLVNPVTDQALQKQGGQLLSSLAYSKLPEDGHCLFHAVGLYVGQDAVSLRSMVAENLEANSEIFLPFTELSQQQFMRRITEIRDSNLWGGHLELIALQHLLDRPIIVLRANTNPMIPDNWSDYQGEPIFVFYNGHSHYDALLLDQSVDGHELLAQMIDMLETGVDLAYDPAGISTRQDAVSVIDGGSHVVSTLASTSSPNNHNDNLSSHTVDNIKKRH